MTPAAVMVICPAVVAVRTAVIMTQILKAVQIINLHKIEMAILIILVIIRISTFLELFQTKFKDKKIKKNKVSKMFNQKNPHKIQQKKTIIPIRVKKIKIFWVKIPQHGPQVKIILITHQHKENHWAKIRPHGPQAQIILITQLGKQSTQ
jgi:hypothetical protein